MKSFLQYTKSRRLGYSFLLEAKEKTGKYCLEVIKELKKLYNIDQKSGGLKGLGPKEEDPFIKDENLYSPTSTQTKIILCVYPGNNSYANIAIFKHFDSGNVKGKRIERPTDSRKGDLVVIDDATGIKIRIDIKGYWDKDKPYK